MLSTQILSGLYKAVIPLAVMSSLSLEDVDSISEALDRDTLTPLPPPNWGGTNQTGQTSAPPPSYPPHGYSASAPMQLGPSTFNYSTESTSQYSSLPPPSLGAPPCSMGQVNPASSVLSGSGMSKLQ